MNAYLCDLKPQAASMLLSPDIYSANERTKKTEVMHLHLSYYNSSYYNDEIKNIKTDDCVRFT